MARAATEYQDERKRHFMQILASFIQEEAVDPDSIVLVVGASPADFRVLRRVGFHNIILSNIRAEELRNCEGHALMTDLEALAVADESADVVVAVEVLHHCRSPHSALCEMLRVSRKYVVFLEPNESLAMRWLVRLQLSFPYELQAVLSHIDSEGGLRDSGIPNFIYRWNEREVRKTVSAFMPEFNVESLACPYWDFTVREEGLNRRKETRLGLITRAIGGQNFIRLLNRGEQLLNLFPLIRKQGNKFCCVISKSDELQRWLRREGNRVVFARERYS